LSVVERLTRRSAPWTSECPATRHRFNPLRDARHKRQARAPAVPGGGTRVASDQFSMTPGAPNDIHEARKLFLACLARVEPHARHVIFHDFDADGVSAGVVLQRALERAGRNVVRQVTSRDRDPWNDQNRAIIRALHPELLFVLDLGSRADRISDAPTCFIDHHRPESAAPGDTLISAYAWDPIPNTSLLSQWLGETIADISDLAWIAAIGTISDLGERAPFDLLAAAKREHGAKWLKEATTLVNAARRSSRHNAELAATALLNHTSPRELVESQRDEVRQMREAREFVAGEFAEAKKAAPKFSGEVALVRVRSSCQVHPLIAQIWRTRLPKYFVLVANDGYVEGRVNFSARSTGSRSVLDFLESLEIDLPEGSYGRGHDHASGGSLLIDDWNRLLLHLGFELTADPRGPQAPSPAFPAIQTPGS